MTMHADQLVGAPASDSDGLEIGTIEQVFRDDVDGTPTWARIRSAKGLHFVPLAGSKMTRSGGLCVPFDSRKILGEPSISVDRHMSVEQEEELRQYFGIRVPAQATRTTELPDEAQASEAQGIQATDAEAQDTEAQVTEEQASELHAGEAHEHDMPGSDWMVRSEERIAVSLETRESGRARLHKYVDAVPIEQTVRVFHEELEIERYPIGDDDQVTGDMTESDQEVILHEARANITKETVPVERVRLSVRKVEEDKIVGVEVRRERIEVVDDGSDNDLPRR
jgi:stress response protein YsnF